MASPPPDLGEIIAAVLWGGLLVFCVWILAYQWGLV
jgi:hypothetical protein